MSANKEQIAGSHYQQAVQTWDFIHLNKIGYLAGNVIKYVVRYKKKNGVEDLRKARHYIDKLIEVEMEAEDREEDQAQNEVIAARMRDGA